MSTRRLVHARGHADVDAGWTDAPGHDVLPLVFRFSAVFLLLVFGPDVLVLAAPAATPGLVLAVPLLAWTGAVLLFAGLAVRSTAAVLGVLALAAVFTASWDATVPSSILTLGALLLLVADLLFVALLGAGCLSLDALLHGPQRGSSPTLHSGDPT